MKHIYSGWTPDPIDTYRAGAALPVSVDLSPNCSRIEDQGQLGSCTGNAITSVLEYELRKAKKTKSELSRLFVYYNERMVEGTINEDAGAIIRDGIKSLVTYGSPSEKSWPYNIAKFTKKPTATAYKRALPNRIVSYQRLTTIDDIKHCLADGSPVVFGFKVFESFESAEVARTGIVPMPTAGERNLGGHCMYIDGYDENGDITAGNSWDLTWGNKGRCKFKEGHIANPNYCGDFWRLKA
jgi:C1A family cysteine protease